MGATFTMTSGQGQCVVVANQSGNTDYSQATQVTQSVSLTQITPTITWAIPAAITYGIALSGAQLNVTASVPGTFSYSPASGVLTAGTHLLSVTFTPTVTTDYTTATASVSLTVNQATPTISWSNPAPISYGTQLTATQLNATVSVAGAFSYSPPSGTMLSAGAHSLSVIFTPTDTTDYTTATATVSISVAAVPLIITAGSPTETYGTLPTILPSYSGFAPGLVSATRA